MRFLLPILALTFLLSPSLSSPEDVLHIQNLIADFAINLDTKDFTAIGKQFIPTAIYDQGNNTEVVTGIPNIKKYVATLVENNVTQSSLTTQRISLFPSLKAQDSASKASATTYAIISYLGQGADYGKIFVAYGYVKDQLVKTSGYDDYGGWRFSARVFQGVVSSAI